MDQVSFLQMFATQCLMAVKQGSSAHADQSAPFIEHLGLSASECLEKMSRKQLGYDNEIDLDQLGELAVNLKNRIGGNFSRASSEPGVVRLVNSRCPFGDAVKQAPELCHMTSSVFGGIAARNFGYAKVHLKQRISAQDIRCEVLIYTEPAMAADLPGYEYEQRAGRLLARTGDADVSVRIGENLRRRCDHSPGLPKKPEIIAASSRMRTVLEAVEIIAPTPATVLINGETGVGKEVVARAIHDLSNRWQDTFLAVNCGTIPSDLMESALFGHEKGAFTGAYDVHHGFFERAERGTLFLDEVDSLPLAAQVKLLRVLQQKEFERVGARQTLRSDVRIIAASNRNIGAMVSSKEFREDLFYRLNVVPIEVPPLRERIEDISALTHHFLDQLSRKYGTLRKTVSPRAWDKLLSYEWRGNVRELENVLERAFLFSQGTVLQEAALALPQFRPTPDNTHRVQRGPREAARRIESQILEGMLQRHHGNVSAVAREWGITPRAVYYKLQAYQIDAARYRKAPLS